MSVHRQCPIHLKHPATLLRDIWFLNAGQADKAATAISFGNELKAGTLQSLHWSMSPVLEWVAGSAVGSLTIVLLPYWKAITEIRIGTVRGTRLAFREAAIKMELSSSPGTALFSPPLYTFSLPRHVKPLQKKRAQWHLMNEQNLPGNHDGNMAFMFVS